MTLNGAYHDYLTGGLDIPRNGSIYPLENNASAKVSQSSRTRGAGQSATFQAQITPQEDECPYSMPAYTGFVELSPDKDTCSILYSGVPSNRTEVGPIMHLVVVSPAFTAPAVYKFQIMN